MDVRMSLEGVIRRSKVRRFLFSLLVHEMVTGWKQGVSLFFPFHTNDFIQHISRKASSFNLIII
jgi:hypothetical protein